MEETLHALGGILLRAIPTFLLVILLHFFLKYSFFGPLETRPEGPLRSHRGRPPARRGDHRAGPTPRPPNTKPPCAPRAVKSTRSRNSCTSSWKRSGKPKSQAARASAEQAHPPGHSAELAADVEQAKQELAPRERRPGQPDRRRRPRPERGMRRLTIVRGPALGAGAATVWAQQHETASERADKGATAVDRRRRRRHAALGLG